MTDHLIPIDYNFCKEVKDFENGDKVSIVHSSAYRITGEITEVLESDIVIKFKHRMITGFKYQKYILRKDGLKYNGLVWDYYIEDLKYNKF